MSASCSSSDSDDFTSLNGSQSTLFGSVKSSKSSASFFGSCKSTDTIGSFHTAYSTSHQSGTNGRNSRTTFFGSCKSTGKLLLKLIFWSMFPNLFHCFHKLERIATVRKLKAYLRQFAKSD